MELQSAIEEFAYYSDEPSADAGALPVWYLSRMSRQHVTVALSGEGADELFGGYLTYLADRLAQPLRLVPGGLRRLMLGALDRYLPVSDDKISLEYKLKRWLEGSAAGSRTKRTSSGTGRFRRSSGRQIRPGSNGNGLQKLVERAGHAGARGAEPVPGGGSELTICRTIFSTRRTG